MGDDLITDDEVRLIKENAAHLTFIKIRNEQVPVGLPKFLKLKSGYRVGYSIDHYPASVQVAHVSISRKFSPVDPAEADSIALAILGEDYFFGGYVENVYQYTKQLSGGDIIEKNVVRGRRIEVS